MKVGILIVFLLTALLGLHFLTQEQSSFGDFEKWKLQHKVQFKSEAEEAYRRSIFETNLAKIAFHNADPSQTYTMGPTQFAIYTEEEFAQRFLSEIPPVPEASPAVGVSNDPIDWEDKGAVGPVRNQGTCGSSAAFSTLGGVEGLSFIQTKHRETFSLKQLTDCVYGCTGSVPDKGYAWYKVHCNNALTQLSAPMQSTKRQANPSPATAVLASSRSQTTRK